MTTEIQPESQSSVTTTEQEMETDCNDDDDQGDTVELAYNELGYNETSAITRTF